MQTRGRVRFHEVEVKDIDAAFAMIREELKKAIENSGNETRPEWIKGSLYSGQLKLYLISVGKRIAGWVMTEITPGSSGPWLHVPFGHSRPEDCDGEDIFKAAIEQLKDTCKQMNFRGVRLMSIRKGMARRAEEFGMTPRFVEYVWETEQE